MKLREVYFDEQEEPTRLVVELSVEEAALIYGFVGHTAPKAVTDRAGIEWGNLHSDLGNDLSSIGARLFEDGWSRSPKLELPIEES